MFDISQTYIGNQEIYLKIKNNFINSSLSHSIIIYGEKGIGKSTFIYFLTNRIFNNFSDDSELESQSNHKNLIYKNIHPNFKIIEKNIDEKTKKEKNYITVDQIRNLETYIYQSSSLSLPKIILIDNVDHLNLNAANCLLKFLEEPKKNTYFFLLSNQLFSLLPTIRSRCIKFKLNKPNYKEFSEIILNQYKKIIEDDLKFLFDLSNGSPGIALELYSEETHKIYNNIVNISKEKKILSNSIIKLSSFLSNQSNEQFRSFLYIFKFILINIIKINLKVEIKDSFISNILNPLFDLSSNLDNQLCIEVLNYLYTHENDLFTYNLDKKIFTINLFSKLTKIQ